MNFIVAFATAGYLLAAALPAAAQLEPAPQRGPLSTNQVRAAALENDSAGAEIGGDHARALVLADEAIRTDPRDGWGYYLRADALVSLNRLDAALASFRDAEQRFPDSDPWGKSVAIWGQGNAYEGLGRCADAAPIYERYAAFVERFDPEAAAYARTRAKKPCTPPAPPSMTPTEIDAANLEVVGNYQGALESADSAIAAAASRGWGHYLRGQALVMLKRFDEAVAAFRMAEARFHASDAWGESLALWGEANALKEAGRCREASPIYERYAALVEGHDGTGAAMAREYAKHTCVPIRASE